MEQFLDKIEKKDEKIEQDVVQEDDPRNEFI